MLDELAHRIKNIRDRWPPIAITPTGAFFVAGDVDPPEHAAFYPKPPRHEEITAAMRRMTDHLQA